MKYERYIMLAMLVLLYFLSYLGIKSEQVAQRWYTTWNGSSGLFRDFIQ